MIYLPHHLSDTVSLPEKNPDIPVERGHETVLLVEDEPAILKMTTRMLDRAGYTVLAAGTPGDAIRLANEHAGESYSPPDSGLGAYKITEFDKTVRFFFHFQVLTDTKKPYPIHLENFGI